MHASSKVTPAKRGVRTRENLMYLGIASVGSGLGG
jgi:hypothetical protein